MNQAPGAVLNYYRWWRLLGCLMLLMVIALSLVRLEQPVKLANADKYEHLLAYGSLMYWWGMVQAHRRRLWMVALPLIGLGLEFAQSLTPYRMMSWNDAAANLLGVIVGAVLLGTPAANVLRLIDREIRNRLDTGGT